MSEIPEDAEKALDELRARKINKELEELGEVVVKLGSGPDLKKMLTLQKALLKARDTKGELGRELRRLTCEEIASVNG
jgi:hypothetical protein